DALPICSPRLDPGLRSSTRRHNERRLAVGRSAGDLCSGLCRGGDRGVRPALGGIVTTHTEDERGAGSLGDITAKAAAPAHTGSRATRVLGVITLVAIAVWAYLGLVATPADEVQQQSVRLLYVHVPVVTIAYLACFLTSAASAMWLWKKSQWWDLVASSSGEIAAVFTAATLASGSIWGG